MTKGMKALQDLIDTMPLAIMETSCDRSIDIIEQELKNFECLDNFFNKLKERYGVDDLDYLEMIVQKYLLNCQ